MLSILTLEDTIIPSIFKYQCHYVSTLLSGIYIYPIGSMISDLEVVGFSPVPMTEKYVVIVPPSDARYLDARVAALS